ncbi:hypothetical protein PGT21_010968 [Puccinia graminis f. sp. tritici]|uniref:Uncharacterized protein n=1 Tax=Puccinia graminis f. sp. tritici TaxID=56615 RepID=A0A5B0NKH3_PUCGR|nr:hypothetical protein PGT21_010968 [Puccinia graminis f. sp. tritici]
MLPASLGKFLAEKTGLVYTTLQLQDSTEGALTERSSTPKNTPSAAMTKTGDRSRLRFVNNEWATSCWHKEGEETPVECWLLSWLVLLGSHFTGDLFRRIAVSTDLSDNRVVNCRKDSSTPGQCFRGRTSFGNNQIALDNREEGAITPAKRKAWLNRV